MIQNNTTNNLTYGSSGYVLRKRCPYCGDSQKHPEKTHFVVYFDSGNFHCHRCGISGYMPLTELLSMALDSFIPVSLQQHKKLKDLGTLPQGFRKIQGSDGPLHRYSHVTVRYSLENSDLKGPLEIFESRNRFGQVTGYQIRASWEKICRSLGSLVLGYGLPDLNNIPNGYIRLVEGPYDVLGDNDVCTWGFPKVSQLNELKYIPLVLCPDGDIWSDEEKLVSWFRPFISSTSVSGYNRCMIEFVEVLPRNSDPDEVPPNERYRVSWDEVKRLVLPTIKGRMVHGTGLRGLPSLNLSKSKSWGRAYR